MFATQTQSRVSKSEPPAVSSLAMLDPVPMMAIRMSEASRANDHPERFKEEYNSAFREQPLQYKHKKSIVKGVAVSKEVQGASNQVSAGMWAIGGGLLAFQRKAKKIYSAGM